MLYNFAIEKRHQDKTFQIYCHACKESVTHCIPQ